MKTEFSWSFPTRDNWKYFTYSDEDCSGAEMRCWWQTNAKILQSSMRSHHLTASKFTKNLDKRSFCLLHYCPYEINFFLKYQIIRNKRNAVKDLIIYKHIDYIWTLLPYILSPLSTDINLINEYQKNLTI